MNFDHSLLCYFVRDSLIAYSDNFRMLAWDNPVRFSLNGNNYSVHVSYVHDSGNTRKNDDEMRIQLQRDIRDTQRRFKDNGEKVAFIGIFEKGDIFIGWEPRYVLSSNAKTSISVYARETQAAETKKHSIGAHIFKSKTLKEESASISLPITALGFYLENMEHFHSIHDVGELRRIMSGYEASNGSEIESNRVKFTYTHIAYPRSPDFSRSVLSAYNYSCAVCNQQLGIVHAAHIIPHSENDATDDIRNGIALCVGHHWLYDTGLLLPGPGGKLFFNETREKFLRNANRANGIEEVKKYANEKFIFPKNAKHHPSEDFLRRGLEIRSPR